MVNIGDFAEFPEIGPCFTQNNLKRRKLDFLTESSAICNFSALMISILNPIVLSMAVGLSFLLIYGVNLQYDPCFKCRTRQTKT